LKCKRDSDVREREDGYGSWQTMRMQALSAVKRGQPVGEVGASFGVAERSMWMVGS